VQDGRGTQVDRKPRTIFLLATVAAAVVVLDQITKSAILRELGPGERVSLLGDLLSLRLARNPGGVFGLFPGAEIFFVLLTTVVVIVVIAWGVVSQEFPLSFGLIAGGGLGNLADRIFRDPGFLRGRVVDFIDLSFWPTFNLADAAISVGVVLLIIGGFRRQLT
jgi:signal peptidase II